MALTEVISVKVIFVHQKSSANHNSLSPPHFVSCITIAHLMAHLEQSNIPSAIIQVTDQDMEPPADQERQEHQEHLVVLGLEDIMCLIHHDQENQAHQVLQDGQEPQEHLESQEVQDILHIMDILIHQNHIPHHLNQPIHLTMDAQVLQEHPDNLGHLALQDSSRLILVQMVPLEDPEPQDPQELLGLPDL